MCIRGMKCDHRSLTVTVTWTCPHSRPVSGRFKFKKLSHTRAEVADLERHLRPLAARREEQRAAAAVLAARTTALHQELESLRRQADEVSPSPTHQCVSAVLYDDLAS